MVSYTVENHPDKSYVMGSVTNQFKAVSVEHGSASGDAQAMDSELNSYLDAAKSPIRVVLDLRDLKISFSDLVQGLGATRPSKSMFQHPNVSEFVIITNSRILRMGSEALAQVQYGSRKVRIFDSFEEATRYIDTPLK